MMQQPTPGAIPPPMAAQPPQQYQYQQPPPQPQQPYMMMNMMPPQGQPAPMWAQQPPAVQLPQSQPQMSQPASSDEVKTLWIGDLQYWMDETYLMTCFSQTGEVSTCKVIRNKQSGQIEGYGFIEFNSHATAERILQMFNGTPMPNSEQNFRLNWASLGSGERRDETPDFTIFVGDLAPDVTDYMLQETFRARFPTVKGAKVVIDRATGRSKGYGFVRFADEAEQNRAMVEMQGAFCSTRAMRLGPASNKKAVVGQQQFPKASNPGAQTDSDPNNTTLFVGNLDTNVTDDHLREVFSQYGQLVHVKIPAGKRCGFVQFADRSCAEEALRALSGSQLGGQNIRLSWGRSTSNRQPQADQNQWNGGGAGYYGYNQGYDYGYAAGAAPPQDPNMYYGGYPAGYGNYQQPPQQQQAGYS